MSQILSALGFSAQQIEVLNKEGVTPEEITPIIDEFWNTQKANIERETISKKKPEFIAEAFNKAKKQLIDSIGIDDSEFKDEKDYKVYAQKALSKYSETLKAGHNHSDDEIKKELERFKTDFLNSQKTIKQLEEEKAQVIEQAQRQIEQKVTEFRVNEQVLKLPLREGKEYILPIEKVVKNFQALSMADGISYRFNDKGQIEVYKGDEPLQRKIDGSRATEFHTLDTYFDEITSDFVKKSNGGGGQGGNGSGQFFKKDNLTPAQIEMMKHAESM